MLCLHLLQEGLLGGLEEEVDTTHSRLKSASKKMQDIIRKSGTTGQLVVIISLIIILAVVAIFAFYKP